MYRSQSPQIYDLGPQEALAVALISVVWLGDVGSDEILLEAFFNSWGGRTLV